MVRVAAGLVDSLTGASLVRMTDDRTRSDADRTPAHDTPDGPASGDVTAVPEDLTEERRAELVAAGIPPEFHGWLGRYGVGSLTVKMGIVFSELGAERTVATMPVEGNRQVVGILHGGAHVVLAETLGSFAANLHAGQGRQAVGIEIGATHHRSIASGLVTGTATAIHLGRTLTTHEVIMTDEQGRRLSTARITNMIMDARP
jgi:1,4-dihydroxy-2-naphthoyl-CoA hydrolase